jgi:hypothetical protein
VKNWSYVDDQGRNTISPLTVAVAALILQGEGFLPQDLARSRNPGKRLTWSQLHTWASIQRAERDEERRGKEEQAG